MVTKERKFTSYLKKYYKIVKEATKEIERHFPEYNCVIVRKNYCHIEVTIHDKSMAWEMFLYDFANDRIAISKRDVINYAIGSLSALKFKQVEREASDECMRGFNKRIKQLLIEG